MNSYGDAHTRSLIKAISWRIIATVATILIVFALTRRLMLSLEVGVVEVIIKLILYYLHERVWGSITYGKKEHPLAPLSIKDSVKHENVVLIKNKLREMGYLSNES